MTTIIIRTRPSSPTQMTAAAHHSAHTQRIHPGRILLEQYMQPLGLTANALAVALKVHTTRIHEIINERRAISPDTAMRLACYFGEDPKYWLSLQNDYDLSLLTRYGKFELDIVPRKAIPSQKADDPR